MDEEAVVGLWAADIITFVYWSAYLLLQMNFFTLMSWSCDLLCIYSRLSSASICVYATRWGTVIRSCKRPSYPSSFLFLRIGLLTEFRGLRLMFRSWILILASCSAWACWIPATTAWNNTSTNTVLVLTNEPSPASQWARIVPSPCPSSSEQMAGRCPEPRCSWAKDEPRLLQ